MAVPIPKLIQIVNREVYYAQSGAETLITYYIEPFDSSVYLLCALLGGVDGQNSRRPPLEDILIPGLYCYEASVVPLDKQQFSYAGNTNLVLSDINVVDLSDALKDLRLDSTKDIDIKIVSSNNKDYSAGAFIQARFKLVRTLTAEKNRTFDYTNFVEDSGIIDHPIPIGLQAATWVSNHIYIADFGISPVIREHYRKLSITRQFVGSLTAGESNILRELINSVNESELQLVAGNPAYTFNPETLKFINFKIEKRFIPNIVNGEVIMETYNNIMLEFEIRTMITHGVHGDDGHFIKTQFGEGIAPITWNHIFLYPGDTLRDAGFLKALGGLVGNNESTLGWYKVGWNTNIFQGGDLEPAYKIQPNILFETLFKMGVSN
jgi:hypothetical protein